MKIPKKATNEELRQIIYMVGHRVLDIAQHLALSKGMKPKYLEKHIERGAQMAYDLAFGDFTEPKQETAHITFIGKEGLSAFHGEVEDLIKD